MNDDSSAYVALGVASTAYAVALNTDAGKRFADEYTWASVVLGTGLVITLLRYVLPREQWQKVVTAFVVAGVPIIARSLLNKFRAA